MSFQGLQPVAGRNQQVIQPASRIQQLQLPLDAAPQVARNPTGRPGVPIAEQIYGRLVTE